MKNLSTLALLALLTPLLILHSGCKKGLETDKIKDIHWTPEFAVPLVNDSITFESALIESGAEKNFYIDESGDISILLYYHDDAFRLTVDDLLDLPPFTFQYDHTFTPAEQQVISSQDYTIPPVTHSIDLSQGNPGVRVDKLLVKNGTMTINTVNSFSNDGYLTLTFLNATKNGIPFSVTSGPFVSGSSVQTVDLSGVLFDLTATPNMVAVEVTGLVKKSSSPAAGDNTSSTIILSVPGIRWFEGYLGQMTFTPPEESVRITVFHNAYNYGDIYFVDPKVSMTLYNSIGVPARITMQKLEAVNSVSGTRLDITNSLGSGAVINVPSPSITAVHPTVTNVDYTNGNTANAMNELFNIKPDHVYYKIMTELNPGGPALNFFSDTSSFYADLNVQLPLYGHFTNLTVVDTFDINLNDEEDIKAMELRTRIENGLPLQARLQAYFTDENYHILDSLCGEDRIFIKEAPVDPSTHLPYPGIYGVKDTTYYLDRSRMATVTGARKLLVIGVLNSSDNGQLNVKIRANQRIKLNFTARVQVDKTLEP